MQKLVTFLLSSCAQIAYFAIFLQAFLMPPPIEFFSPCACITEPLTLKNILVVNNIPETTNSRLMTLADLDLKSNDGFCKDRIPVKHLALQRNMTLGTQLENLLTTVPTPVQVCMTLNHKGHVVNANTRHRYLSFADRLLISNYIKENWSFSPLAGSRARDFSGDYALNLDVIQLPERPTI